MRYFLMFFFFKKNGMRKYGIISYKDELIEFFCYCWMYVIVWYIYVIDFDIRRVESDDINFFE